MKKNTKLILLSILLLIILSILGIIIYSKIDKVNKNKIAQEKQTRYSEIREIVTKGVKNNLNDMYPKCPIIAKLPEDNAPGTHYNAQFLIENGYIKQKDLLDYDKKSYCDIFVKVKCYRKDPLDEQNNCNVSYKLYLKCNGYEEKGYQNWG